MAQNKQVIEEYIVSLSPELDNDKYKKATAKLRSLLNKEFKAENKLTDPKSATKTATAFKSIAKSGISLKSAIGTMPGKLALVVASIKIIKDLMTKITEQSKSFSNSIITAQSAFINKDTRNIMASFGVSGTQATGISKSLNLMGLSTNDLKIMTPGQLNLFSRLMKTWNNGINSIDQDKLRYYNETIQNFQSEMAISKLERQIALQKMLVELSPQLNEFFNVITQSFKNFTNIMTSPLVKSGINILTKIATAYANLFNFWAETLDSLIGNNSILGKFFNAIFGGKIGQTTVTIDASSTNTFNGDTSSMLALSSNISENQNKVISNAQFSTGRA